MTNEAVPHDSRAADAPADPIERAIKVYAIPRRLITISETAGLFGISRAGVYGLIKDGKLKTVQARQHQRVAPTEAARYLIEIGA